MFFSVKHTLGHSDHGEVRDGNIAMKYGYCKILTPLIVLTPSLIILEVISLECFTYSPMRGVKLYSGAHLLKTQTAQNEGASL